MMIFSSILPHSLIEESLSSSQHDKFLLQQYLAQPPHDDAGLYPRILEYSLDDKGRASIIFHSILVQKKIAQFEKLLIQEAKASLNCLQLPTSCSFIASLCDPQATSKAAKSSARPVQSPNDSDSRTPNGRLILGESSLCEQLQRFSLDDDPANTDQPESRQTFPLTPPIAISDDPQTAKGNFIEISTLNYSHSDQNYLESQLLPRHLPINAARSFNSHPRMERQEQEQEQEQHSTISDYSSSSSSPHSEEIFSLENSSSNDTNSVSIFIRGDDEEAALYNGMAEQVSRSDLVNEFARFTISWFIAWTANRRNNMGSDSHNQEVRTYERQNSGRCTCGNGRKRPRENGHSGRTKKQQKRDDSNEEDDHDDSKRNISSITKSLPNKCLKPLACPFFQRDQLSFGHGRWKLCAHGSWNEYHRVREHVYRKHILPTNHCDRCFKDLKDAQTLLQHRNQSQCEQTALLYTTADRILQLKLPMKRGIEESQKWEIMYRILFPDDIHVPSPYKEEPFYFTKEVRVLAAGVERICNSSFPDALAQMEQIRDFTEQTMCGMNGIPSSMQHNLQEIHGASSATSTDNIAAGYSGTLNMSSFPNLSILEYMELSTSLMGDLLSEDLTPVLGGQDRSVFNTLEPSYNTDIFSFENAFQVDDDPDAEQTSSASDISDTEDES